MKKIILMLFLALSVSAHQGIFQSVDEKDAVLLQTGENKTSCLVCGMDLPMFYKTSHAVKFKDGTYRQYCSLNCLVDDLELGALKDKKDQLVEVLVVDVKTLKMIDAKTAFYVVGSKKPGTMSMTSKYAFKNKQDAKQFQNENGGKLLKYETVYKITLKEFTN